MTSNEHLGTIVTTEPNKMSGLPKRLMIIVTACVFSLMRLPMAFA